MKAKQIIPALLLTLLASALPAVAQEAQSQPASETRPKAEKVVIKPSYAWTVGEPLGMRYPSTIDTLFENYHRYAVPWAPSTVWATTGNYGAPGQDQIFFNRPYRSEFFFEDAITPWLHNTSTVRFYNTRIPMTLLSYTTGGDKYSNQDRTKVIFSGNAGKRLQVGADIDYVYSKGSYEYQADKDFTWRLFGSYTGDRYELQTHFTHYELTNKENGGITDDRFITDPAEVQGGVTKVDNKSIPTYLTAAHNYLKSTQFYMNHRYKVGFYRNLRDSVTDTIIGREYVPVTSFIWTFDYNNKSHRYLDTDGVEDTAYYANTYLRLGGTDDTTKAWTLRNTFGVSLLEGFNKWAKFGLSAYVTHEVQQFTQAVDTVTSRDVLPEGLDLAPVAVDHKHTRHLLWVGGQLTKHHGSLLRYDATAQFGVLGDVAGNINIDAGITTRIKIARDTASLRAYTVFKNTEPPYLLKNYVSNHFIWKNNFDKQQRFRIGGEINIPHTWTSANVGYETLKNYVYFDSLALPRSHSDAIHVFSATVNQGFHFKAFGWENSLTFQSSSDKTVLPLPSFAIYSNMYVKFLVARVLHVQIGADCSYYTEYYAPAYNPATMTFHSQNKMKCGDFALVNVYANFKLKRARFFIACNHVNAKMFGGDNYFSIPHYPLNPRRIQFGVSVDFAN